MLLFNPEFDTMKKIFYNCPYTKNTEKNMKDLKMYFTAGTPVKTYTLPEGYSLCAFKDCSEDVIAWLNCCKNGLLDDDADEGSFERGIRLHEFTVPERDVIFLDYLGEHIGTVTAVHHTDDNTGEMHMVGLRPEFRGKGLVKHLNAWAVKRLTDKGVRYIALTTDDWRKSAIKSYISAGFCPVDYDTHMVERWTAILKELNIESISLFDIDAKPLGFLTGK